jgi:hypothetical protein
MKPLFHPACLACFALYCAVACADDSQPKQFPRGARPSPRHKILAAPQHQATAPTPAQFARIPGQNSTFGNDQYGNCVTAEEAFSKSCDGVFLSTAVVVDWARQHGFLNGADLISVMEAMASDGFPGTPPQLYDDGPYSTVNYSDETLLKNAIAVGNVKIAIDASALPSTAGNQQGWFAVGGGNWPNTDHCVSICGYGPAEYLYTQLTVAMPPSLAGTSGYLVDTWGTVGFVDHAWLMASMAGAGEAYVRNPTTVLGPSPGPQPTPAPPKHRLTFVELIQLLIARLHPHLTPAQAEAVADFFADPNAPRVKLLERIVYRRARHAGLNLLPTNIGAVNWQELLKIVEELEPLIVPLIPVLFGDEQASEGVRRQALGVRHFTPAFTLCATQPKYRKQCGPDGCKLVPIDSGDKATTGPTLRAAHPVGGASRPVKRRWALGVRR